MFNGVHKVFPDESNRLNRIVRIVQTTLSRTRWRDQDNEADRNGLIGLGNGRLIRLLWSNCSQQTRLSNGKQKLKTKKKFLFRRELHSKPSPSNGAERKAVCAKYRQNTSAEQRAVRNREREQCGFCGRSTYRGYNVAQKRRRKNSAIRGLHIVTQCNTMCVDGHSENDFPTREWLEARRCYCSDQLNLVNLIWSTMNRSAVDCLIRQIWQGKSIEYKRI